MTFEGERARQIQCEAHYIAVERGISFRQAHSLVTARRRRLEDQADGQAAERLLAELFSRMLRGGVLEIDFHIVDQDIDVTARAVEGSERTYHVEGMAIKVTEAFRSAYGLALQSMPIGLWVTIQVEERHTLRARHVRSPRGPVLAIRNPQAMQMRT